MQKNNSPGGRYQKKIEGNEKVSWVPMKRVEDDDEKLGSPWKGVVEKRRAADVPIVGENELTKAISPSETRLGETGDESGQRRGITKILRLSGSGGAYAWASILLCDAC